MRFLSMVTAAALLAMASVAFAQSTGSSTPSVTPSYTPSVTPSQTPSVTPSQTPSVTPSQTPSVTPSQTPVGGLSKCENLLGIEKDTCLQQERAGAGTGSTGTGAGTMGTQNPAPSGTVR